jgi:hypothetical protein
MDRSEIIRRLVLSEIADDYENVDQCIFPYVSEECGKRGVKVERSDIVEALAGLIGDGLAKAYVLSSREPHASELSGMPSVEIVEEDFETYFYITRKGLDLLDAWDGWATS